MRETSVPPLQVSSDHRGLFAAEDPVCFIPIIESARDADVIPVVPSVFGKSFYVLAKMEMAAIQL